MKAGQAQALDQLTDALAVLAVLIPPVPHLLDELLELVVGLFHLDEGDDHRTHLGAFEDRGLGAHQDAGAGVQAGAQGAEASR